MMTFNRAFLLSLRGAILIFLFACLGLLDNQAFAGQWRIKRYKVESYQSTEHLYNNNGKPLRITYGGDWDGENLETLKPPAVKKYTNEVYDWMSFGAQIGAGIVISSYNQYSAPAKAKCYMNVTPVFEWEGEDEPTKVIYYRELCRMEFERVHDSRFYSFYPPLQPYDGHHFQITAKNPWNIPLYDNDHTTPHGGVVRYPTLQFDTCNSWKVSFLITKGRIAYGRTRQYSGEVSTSGVEPLTGAESSIRLYYNAEIVPFSFNLTTAYPLATITNEAYHKYQIAEADKSWKGTAIDAPIEMFYDGKASYEVAGQTLLSTLGNPTYTWTTNKNVVKPWDIFGEPPLPVGAQPTPTPAPDSQIVKESTVAPSSPVKHFHHDVGEKTAEGWKWPQMTSTKVEVKGNDPKQPTLYGYGDVAWYPGPQTRFTTEMEVDVIDLETGEITPFAEVTDGASPVDDEEADIDAYIEEIEGKKKETFETGKALVAAALETQMIVGSWYVPDLIADGATGEIDPLTALPLIGKFAKAVQVVKVLDKAVGVANKLGPKSLKMVNRLRPTGKWALRTRIRALKNGKPHALPPGVRNGDDEANGLERTADCFDGIFCFVKGTLVLTPEGNKAIEQLRVGDLVIARSESTGEVAAKRITHTLQKQAPATLVLKFTNGERIETTEDHPFYEEHKGFTPAGLLAIGNSIVTRAGPALKLESIEKHQHPSTVYNLTVDEFNTYYVGKSAVWVHNQNCPAFGAAMQRADEIFKNWGIGIARPGMACGMVLPGLGTLTGYSKRPTKWGPGAHNWTADPAVLELYDRLIPDPKNRGSNHGGCAEVMVLSEAFSKLRNQGYTDVQIVNGLFTGGKSASAQIGNGGGHGSHLSHAAPCKSCKVVLDYLKITF